MKQLKQLLLVMAIALTGFTPAQAQTQWTHYSEWMANTQKSYVYSDDDYWRYDDGLMYESILDTYEHYKNGGGDFTDATLKNAVKAYIDACVNSTGSITNYKSGDLDDIRPARMVYKYYKLYGGDNLKTACKTVMACNAFKDNARVISQSTGYPWQHKADYTEQVWLDGIFMGLPYWTLAGPDAEIGSSLHSSWSANDFFNDAVSQMQKTDEKTYEPTIGLWCHAWDATEPFSLFWSTKNKNFTDNTYSEKHSPYELIPHDGRSSHCWGRALGWYAMAIMETMDNIAAVNGAADSRITTLKALFKKVMDKVVETRDPSEGVWHCVIDVDATQAPYKDYSTKNNYLEATCSAMFTYCLLHGVAQGYLDSSYLPVAKDAYNKFITKFIDGTGTNLTMSNCMSVGGLGPGENYKSPNYKRDGSYAYYMSESIVSNDSKGVGPFIWASLEAEKTYGYTIKGGFSKPVVSDDIVQFRWSRIADDFTVPGTTPSSFVSPTFTAKTYGGTPKDNATSIKFSSDNEAVATVANDGTITLEGGEGTANITATMTNGNYAGSAIYTVTTTGTDTTKPTFVSSTPATTATNVAVSGNIVLTFSEAVTVADASNITLTGGAGTLDKEHATTDGATITIPYSGLANSTTYTLNIAAGAVKDLSENTNEDVNAITFTTIAPDLTAPSLSGHSITDGATDVATSGTIVLTFSEDVTCTTNATLTTTGSSAINLTPSVSGTTVTYSYSGLTNSTSYTFNLAANSVADLAGNKYASAINIEFTTKEAVSGNTLVVTNTSATSETFADGTILYSIDSDGRQNSSTKFGSNDIVSEGSKVKGPSLSDKRFVVKFPEDVSSVTIYGYNSSSGRTLNTISTSSTMTKESYTDITSSTTKTTSTSTPNYNYVFTTSWNTPIAANTYIWYEFNNSCNFYKIEYTTPSTPTPTTFTLTNTVNTEGYGTVSPTTVANIPSGTTTSSSSNTYTVGGTEVTATPTAATAEYTYTFSGWSGLPSTVKANTTVTANFTRTAKEYTLEWNSNGGSALSGDYTSGTVPFGTAITAPNNPTRSGYTFNGWNTADDGSGTPLGSTMPAANTTYYAQWTENTLPAAPEFSPEEGNVNGGTEVSITSTDATTIYYQISESSTPLAIGNSGWSTYSSAVVLPNITGTRYLHAYGVNTTGNSTVSTAIYTLTENAGGGEPETYKLVNDPTGTPTFSGDFLTGNLTLNQNTAQTIDGISFKKAVQFGSTLTSINGKNVGDNNICYDVKTSSTKFTVYVAKTTGNLVFSSIAEGATTTTTENKIISNNPQKLEFTYNSTTNTRVGFSVSNTGMYIYQIIAEESGTPHKQAGEAGYVLNFNKGRYSGFKASSENGKSGKIDNIEIASYASYTHTSTTALELSKNSADTYLKFTTGASACKLKATFSAGTLIANTSQSTSGGIALTTATAQELAANTTYYIINTNSGTRASISKIEFEAAAAPTTYKVCKGAETNGTFNISTTSAEANEIVTVTTSPATNYSVGDVTVTKKAGSGTVTVTNTAANTYTFTMPASDVTVNVTFNEAVSQVATPVISPVAGTVFAGTTQNVSISCATAGANIYYTLDGTTPTSSSTRYTSAFTIYGTKTVKAIAIKEGMTNSTMASATITNTCLNEYNAGGEASSITLDSSNDDQENTIGSHTTTWGTVSLNNPDSKKGGVSGDYKKFGATTWTLTLPTGYSASSITFTGKSNATSGEKTTITNVDGEALGTAYSFDYSNASEDSKFTYNFTTPQNEITFVVTGYQLLLTITLTAPASDGTLLLKEAATAYTPTAATGIDVTLTRTLQANKWNALCLPFDVTPAMFSSATNGATTNLETLKGVNNGIFTFAEVTEVAAGTPFIAKPASNIVNPTFSDVEIKAVSPGSTTKDGYKFQGTYTKVTLDPATNLFISMSQQKMVPPTGSNILQGLRAYFTIPEGEGARVGLDFNAFIEEITTDINQLNMEHLPLYSDDNTPLYNLSGQRVSKSYKGIVIVNGKKVLRK